MQRQQGCNSGAGRGGVYRGEHPPERSLSAVEKQHIERVRREEDGNISRAAITLGIDRGTLYNKMKRYGIRRVE